MSTVYQITPYYPPHLGGLERVVQHLAAGLGARHDVRVITTTIGADGAPPHARDGSVAVRRHRSVEVAHTPVAPGLLASLLRAPRGAVLHLHSAHALLPELVALAARARGQRFVLHFHLDVDASGPMGRLLPAYKKHVFARVLRAAAAVIVLSEAQAEFVAHTYRVPADRVFVVPNGVDRRYFMPVRDAVGQAAAERPLRLLYVGRLSAQKNVGRLLDAMARVTRPVHLRIVGDGELRGELQAQAARLGLADVTFAGSRLGADLVGEYADADAFVLPSDKEGMPLVVLEAMAAALPVVATRVPGTAELLDGVGLLAAPEPAALAAAVDQVAADPALRRDLGGRSAAAARAYTWDAVVEQVEDVYAKALS
ncbi:glycosyltransferase family 4 protein [Streptomyces sp. B1866]|uniref:glycosyltransferase family 4 protein n=1 Tax=Streptomyces sp. B1866 TaxID=3075431 RepID=UPI00288E1267|nr:glycosyltransferase family 4 protein [Streptomyces sp. B1866]MDT3400666.1 glycosyltransferase family 4 protein [Streptomyces sp. B1866]